MTAILNLTGVAAAVTRRRGTGSAVSRRRLRDRRGVITIRLVAGCAAGLLMGATAEPVARTSSPAVQQLADEVRAQGWLCYAARSEHGDWDLFACRPDGSARGNLTGTPTFSEFAPQFSRDGRQLLYRRVPRNEVFDRNRHGEQGELVLANRDGSAPRVLGKPGEFSWASWGPDARQIACLSIKGLFFFDVATSKEVRRFDRKGFFQQVTWSPDGRWLVGVANSFGTGWSVARMDATTGQANAVNTVDCCTPDWFPDSREVIFSWRPPGQKANKGYGWTQLWMADAQGKSRRLVYGEEGRHVYGGHVSPDGKYVLFTGNMEEDGDPDHAGAPMALMRLSDGPIIGGESRELRALHPKVNDGTVLTLPVGWEPCWTFGDLLGAPAPSPENPPALRAAGQPPALPASPSSDPSDSAATLAAEVRALGWLVFSSKTERGDWDLFRMRPDATDRRRFFDLPGFNEGGARFSPDGRQVLFYRLPMSDALQNNEYGTGELVVANADGSEPVVFGSGYSWATWSPDGRQLACLAPKGIQIVDVASRKTVRQLPRKGIVSQLGWSPDGKWFTGTADHLGPFWNIARMNADSGEIRAVSETERYNCTPDWVADSRRVVYARGIIGGKPGRAELWVATLEGQPPQPLYAEEGHHIYGACASPDLKYLLFTRHVADATRIELDDTTMAIIRWTDTPMRGDDGESLKQRFPAAKTGPRLDLGPGWEPTWVRDLPNPAADH